MFVPLLKLHAIRNNGLVNVDPLRVESVQSYRWTDDYQKGADARGGRIGSRLRTHSGIWHEVVEDPAQVSALVDKARETDEMWTALAMAQSEPCEDLTPAPESDPG